MTANQYTPPEFLAKTSIFMPEPYDFVLDALQNDSGNIKIIEIITFDGKGVQYCFHCCNKELLGDESAKCKCPLCLQKNEALEVTIPKETVFQKELTLSKLVDTEPEAIFSFPKPITETELKEKVSFSKPVVEIVLETNGVSPKPEAVPEANGTLSQPIVASVVEIVSETNDASPKPEAVPEANGTLPEPIAEFASQRKVTPRKRKPKIIQEATDSSSPYVGRKIIKNGSLQKKKILKSKNDPDLEKEIILKPRKVPEKKTCPHCRIVYYSVSNLNRHIRRTHKKAEE